MKTIYIFLCRSGTFLSRMVSQVTHDTYTHVSLAFDDGLETLYSSSRKNGYTLFPAGPCREFLNSGVFGQSPNIPCAVYALQVTDEAYQMAKEMAEEMSAPGNRYHFNIFGLILCKLNIRLPRRNHFFCSQFISQVLQDSHALDLPKHSTLMRPSDYTRLPQLQCLYRGMLEDLPQRQQMEICPPMSVMAVYSYFLRRAAYAQMTRSLHRVRRFF